MIGEHMDSNERFRSHLDAQGKVMESYMLKRILSELLCIDGSA